MTPGESAVVKTTESLQSKRESDRARAKMRINIGVAFERQGNLRDLMGLKTDAEMERVQHFSGSIGS